MKSLLKPDRILTPNRPSATLKVLNHEALQPHHTKVMWSLSSKHLFASVISSQRSRELKITNLHREEIERERPNEAKLQLK